MVGSFTSVLSNSYYKYGKAKIILCEKPCSENLRDSLIIRKISQKSNLILLQVDRSVPVQHMIQVVDIANSLHAQVSVATRPD